MNTLIRPLIDVRRTLDIDLVADFTCPWSWLGMAQLTRALGSLSGDVETRLRWHPFRMASEALNAAPRSFHDYLAARLPAGISAF
jgi:predicted DsbA family dithiol-disulfide isomerase